MIRKILSLSVILMLIASVPVNAKLSIVESPHVKIVIDGLIGDYEDVPLIVNDRTMLPLRAVLTNLGVPNDDDHILWNSEERSVTVINGDTTIWLQVDNYTALVNGDEVTLDVAPMIYAQNNRTYIPARFVSEALGKKVSWDGSTTAVLITDMDRYNRILEVVEKSREAMEGTENYEMTLESTLGIESTEGIFNLETNVAIKQNPQQPASYLKLGLNADIEGELGQTEMNPTEMEQFLALMSLFSMEIYEMEDYTYSKNFFSGDKWIKSETDPEKDVADNSNVTVDKNSFVLKNQDTIISGLIMEDKPEEGVIELRGTVYIQEMVDQNGTLSNTDMAEGSIDDYYLVYVLDGETYELISGSIDMTITAPDEQGNMATLTSGTEVTYKSYDEDYVIEVPDEVLENIMEEGSGLFGF